MFFFFLYRHIKSFILAFKYLNLTIWKTHKSYVFGNVVQFLCKGYLTRVLAFWYVRSLKKKNTKYTVLIFYNECFSFFFFTVCCLISSKNTLLTRFWECRVLTPDRVICIYFGGLVSNKLELLKRCFWYCCLLFTYRVICVHFSVLVPNNLNNTHYTPF